MRDQFLSIYRAALFFLSALLLVWAFVPDYRVYVNGLILGSAVSLINAWILSVKIEALTKVILDKSEDSGRRRFNMGFISRISVALLAIIIAVKVPHLFHIAATIIGFAFVQVVVLLKGLFFSRKK
ncbi:ATP synthase subunit I [Paenibacillus sp. YYML68]|uniref:ATP synthase subunit I n=1 Tax=Paenibacillus sp. YYML68 TaxID=2909250 RepID=UPI0024909EA0|nr:ATP synthase subunit I [Paenibacillus sp. YYML68]